MHIIILGAGDLGKQLAWTLCERPNAVAVVDESAGLLERLKERLDVMTVQGDCANFSVLKNAGVRQADILIAATGSDASNVLACQIARHFGVKKTICRLSSHGFFSEKDGFPASTVGIDHVIFPQEETVERITYVLRHKSLVERIRFDVPGTQMTALHISNVSPLVGVQLRDFPHPELLSRLRFSAIVRDRSLEYPHGDTVLQGGDEVYVSGDSQSVESLMDLADPDHQPFSLVVVAGITRVSKILIQRLLEQGYKVRVVAENVTAGERLLDDLPEKVMVINGNPTESDVLEEAEVSDCGAFISTMRADEENILSGLLAKKMGADKVITVTNKAEYMDIVPALSTIDCGFSPRLVAVNAVLNLLGTETARVHAILHRFHAYVYEFEVQEGSPLCGKLIEDFESTPSTIFSLVFRDNRMIPATGDVRLQAGDQVAAITTPEVERLLEPLFRKHSILSRK